MINCKCGLELFQCDIVEEYDHLKDENYPKPVKIRRLRCPSCFKIETLVSEQDGKPTCGIFKINDQWIRCHCLKHKCEGDECNCPARHFKDIDNLA